MNPHGDTGRVLRALSWFTFIFQSHLSGSIYMLGYEFSVVLSVMLLCIWLGLCCVLSSFFDHFIYFKFGEVIDFRLFRATVRRIVARRGSLAKL